MRTAIYNRGVRRLATFVVMLLLMTGAAPVLACVTGAAMSKTQTACCREMHGQCGEMAKTGCCGVELKSDVQPQLMTAAVSMDVRWVWLGAAWVPMKTGMVVSGSGLKAPDQHSPPGLVVARISKLRI